MRATVLLDHDAPTTGHVLTLRALLRVEGDAPESGERAPLNLGLVLDRSGSMAGEKLAAAREAAALLVRRLGRDDVVSVVVYDDQVTVLAEPGKGADQQHLPTALAQVSARGTTNLSGGWLRGRELVARALEKVGVNRILLLTDGLANVGITDRGQLAGLCREAQRGGITTTTIGFGTGFDEDLLRAMADAGGGATYYIESPDQAPGVFEEELEGLLSTVAQNLTVHLELEPTVQIAAVHHSYPSAATPSGLRLDVGDLYAREPRSLLVELRVRVAEGSTTMPVAKLTLAGDVLLAGGGVEHREIVLPITFSAVDGPRVDPVVRMEMLLQDAAKAREDAIARQDRGDYDGAAQVLRSTYARLRDAGVDDVRILEEASDLAALAERAEHGFAAMDVKYAKQRAHDVRRSKLEARERYRRT